MSLSTTLMERVTERFRCLGPLLWALLIQPHNWPDTGSHFRCNHNQEALRIVFTSQDILSCLLHKAEYNLTPGGQANLSPASSICWAALRHQWPWSVWCSVFLSPWVGHLTVNQPTINPCSNNCHNLLLLSMFNLCKRVLEKRSHSLYSGPHFEDHNLIFSFLQVSFWHIEERKVRTPFPKTSNIVLIDKDDSFSKPK